MDTVPVGHDQRRGAFTVLEEGGECVLEYVLGYERGNGRGDPSSVAFVRTYVPPALRGRGIAERLVVAGLSWARSSGLRVSTSCSYVASYLGAHPEWDDLRFGGTRP